MAPIFLIAAVVGIGAIICLLRYSDSVRRFHAFDKFRGDPVNLTGRL